MRSLAVAVAIAIMMLSPLSAEPETARKVKDDALGEQQSMPSFGDEDIVEVYHLQSQILVNDTEQFGVPFLMASTGLAFRSFRTLKVVVMEYAPSRYSQCLLPLAGEASVKWSCDAEIQVVQEVDSRRWKHSTYLTHVSGLLYNRFIRWASGYSERFPLYAPMAVCSPGQSDAIQAVTANTPVKDFSKCYKQSSTHEDFVTRAFAFLASLGVQLRPLIVPQQTRLVVVAQSEPRVVRYNDLAFQLDIVHFYNNFIQCTKEDLKTQFGNGSAAGTASLDDVVQAVARCRATAGYVVLNDQEYYYVNTVDPYAQAIVVPQLIPDAESPTDPGGDAVDWLLMLLIVAVFVGGLYYTFRRLEGKPCLDPVNEDEYEVVGPRRRKRKRPYEWMPNWLFHMLSHNEPHVHDAYANGTYYEMSQPSHITSPQRDDFAMQYSNLPLVDMEESSSQHNEEHFASV